MTVLLTYMKFKVAVVGGAGHIGLPLSCFIQNKGIQTIIIDKNEKALSLIKQSILHLLKKISNLILQMQTKQDWRFLQIYQILRVAIL